MERTSLGTQEIYLNVLKAETIISVRKFIFLKSKAVISVSKTTRKQKRTSLETNEIWPLLTNLGPSFSYLSVSFVLSL